MRMYRIKFVKHLDYMPVEKGILIYLLILSFYKKLSCPFLHTVSDFQEYHVLFIHLLQKI
jgi:hypothetical protein